MANVTLLLRVTARSGNEEALAVGLDAALARLRVHTLAGGWTRVRLGPATFGVFETRAPLRAVRGSGTWVAPQALLDGLEHLIDGAPQLAQPAPPPPPLQRARLAAGDALPPIPAALRLF